MPTDLTSVQPLVSIIAVCYNHARFVTTCLESLRTQRYQNVQVILFDDASKDDSVAVIRDWLAHTDFDCNFVPHSINTGLCRTLNEALALAKGKYISLIATDDTWEPDRLIRSVSHLEAASEDVGVVFTDVYQMDEEGLRLPQTFFQTLMPGQGVPQGNILDALVEGNFVPAMGALVRRTVYERIGNYDERLLYEDWDFWLRAAEHYQFEFIDQPSANYRIVSTSLARAHLAKDTPASLYTYFLVHYRLLSVAKLTENSRILVGERLANTARELYAISHPDLPRFACRFIRKSKKPASRLMCLLCWLGVSWPRYSRFSGYWRWRINSLLSRNTPE